MRKTVLALAAVTTLVVGGCATNPDGSVNQNQRAQTGAVIGAIGGGVVGKQVGGRQGTIAGAVLGGLAGGLIGNELDKQQQALEAAVAANVDRVDDRTIRLTFANDVTFATGSSTLQPRFRADLDEVVASARRYGTSRIRVVGHTDNTGSMQLNQRLSEQRAQSVADYLADRGVSASLEVVGRGESQPVATNATSQGRALNRRVELLLIKE